MIEVKDNDGHTYIIPAYMEPIFTDMLFDIEIMGNSATVFNEKFSKYMKNPDDLKLYTDEI